MADEGVCELSVVPQERLQELLEKEMELADLKAERQRSWRWRRVEVLTDGLKIEIKRLRAENDAFRSLRDNGTEMPRK